MRTLYGSRNGTLRIDVDNRSEPAKRPVSESKAKELT